jgi:hypothetical protein
VDTLHVINGPFAVDAQQRVEVEELIRPDRVDKIKAGEMAITQALRTMWRAWRVNR